MSRSTRRTYIDWARGIAVLIMIEAHVLDAWTLQSERGSVAFGYLNILGGAAAPLFLWLAGLALVLAAEQGETRTGDRRGAGLALMRRGLEIFVLAFIFRAQSFIVSPGNPLVSLLRVDILNIMGPSLLVAALLWWLAGGPRRAVAVCGAVATAVALAAPLVRTAPWLTLLPPAVAWYISPSGNHSTFTLFPWAGFVFAGAAYGVLLARTGAGEDGRTLGRLAATGAFVAAGSYYASTLPTIYAASSFWTTSPTYFGLRVGLLMLLLAALFLARPLAAVVPRAFSVLARFGRHSLFVYWVHVELVYGYATAWIHHRLPLWLNAIVYVAFVACMLWTISLQDRVLAWWRERRTAPPAQDTAGA